MNASIAAMLVTNEASRPQKSSGGKSGDASTTTPSNAATTRIILVLNPNDVIQGRGTGAATYEGNVKFRELVKEYKEEYMSEDTNRHMKAVIANKVFNEIRSRGGRFVRKEKKLKVQGKVFNKEVYYELHEKDALEKCKQALRTLYGWGKRLNDASSHRKRPVQPTRKRPVQPTRTTEPPPLSHGENSSQLARLQMNQLRRLYTRQRSEPSTIRERTAPPPPIDSSSTRMILLQRAQIAAQEKADLYKQALIQLASDEIIGASLPAVLGHLNQASAHRQAMSSRPSFSPTQPRAVPESLLQDLAAYLMSPCPSFYPTQPRAVAESLSPDLAAYHLVNNRNEARQTGLRTPSIDTSQILLLQRAQIAAQKETNLYEQALIQIQLALEETIGASLPGVGHLNQVSAHRQASSSRPSFSPTQPLAVSDSLLQDLAPYCLAKSRNESRRNHATASPEASAETNRIHSGRIAEFTSQQSGINDPSSEMFAREDAVAALSVLAMACRTSTFVDKESH